MFCIRNQLIFHPLNYSSNPRIMGKHKLLNIIFKSRHLFLYGFLKCVFSIDNVKESNLFHRFLNRRAWLHPKNSAFTAFERSTFWWDNWIEHTKHGRLYLVNATYLLATIVVCIWSTFYEHIVLAEIWPNNTMRRQDVLTLKTFTKIIIKTNGRRRRRVGRQWEHAFGMRARESCCRNSEMTPALILRLYVELPSYGG